ncbi:MAG: PKD domain-containing protein [Methanobacteriales archaeon]|nr:MAG: putative pseudomurein-binding protein [Methanobacteriaceae archaeon 41_258]
MEDHRITPQQQSEKINYQSLIYAYARIIKFHNTAGRLPNYVTIVKITGIEGVVAKPQASIGYNIQNYRVQFTDKSTGSTQSRTWDFGDGSKSIEKNPTHTYQPGTYTIKLTIQGYGITDTKTTTITILPEPIQAKLTINTTGNWLQYPGQINLPLHNGINWISTYFKEAGEPGVEEVGIIQDGEIKGKYYFYDWTPGTPTTVGLECNNLQVTRNEKIYYDNMGGFEKLITFTIVTSKVTDEAIKDWTRRVYEPGPLKAAYGTFLTSLTTIWLHDKLADELAKQCNTTWARTKPTIIQAGITDAWTAYTHIPDQKLGIEATGGQIEAFNFLRGLYQPLIEQLTLSFTGQNTNSSIQMITQAILNGKELQITFDQEKLYLEVEGLPGINLTINTVTGEVKDNFYGLGGATADYCYCYHDQLTNKVNSWLGQFLKSSTEATAAGILITAGLMVAAAAGGPLTGIVAGALITGGLIFAADASGLFDDPLNPVNWLDFAATVGSAVFFKAPIGASPFKIITDTGVRQSMRFITVFGGKTAIVKATLGEDGKEAIENTVKSWVKGSGISSVIHSLESSPHN